VVLVGWFHSALWFVMDGIECGGLGDRGVCCSGYREVPVVRSKERGFDGFVIS
jgi:hypothetical protein